MQLRSQYWIGDSSSESVKAQLVNPFNASRLADKAPFLWPTFEDREELCSVTGVASPACSGIAVVDACCDERVGADHSS
jgi:hypothetical protein